MGMHHVWPCGDLEHQFLVTVRKGFLKRKVSRKPTSSNIVTQIVDALMGASEQEQVAMMMKVAWSYPQKWLQIREAMRKREIREDKAKRQREKKQALRVAQAALQVPLPDAAGLLVLGGED